MSRLQQQPSGILEIRSSRFLERRNRSVYIYWLDREGAFCVCASFLLYLLFFFFFGSHWREREWKNVAARCMQRKGERREVDDRRDEEESFCGCCCVGNFERDCVCVSFRGIFLAARGLNSRWLLCVCIYIRVLLWINIFVYFSRLGIAAIYASRLCVELGCN